MVRVEDGHALEFLDPIAHEEVLYVLPTTEPRESLFGSAETRVLCGQKAVL